MNHAAILIRIHIFHMQISFPQCTTYDKDKLEYSLGLFCVPFSWFALAP